MFVAKKPECRSYYELASTGGLSFKFPNPGRLEGINSNSKKVRVNIFFKTSNREERYRRAK